MNAEPIKRRFDRAKLLQLLAIGKTQLGWDDEFYRGIWLPQQGAIPDDNRRYSANSLGNIQLMNAVEEMKRLGFKVKAAASHRPLADDQQSKKIRALWLELHERGKVRDPSEAALAAYVRRQTKVEALQWLDNAQASRVIEALKKWLGRPMPAKVGPAA
jgi:phage gp16-like protein